MKRRKWDSKATLILEGLKGKPVAAICQEYQNAHAQRGTAVAPRVDQSAGAGARAHRVDRVVQHEVFAFSTWLSDTVPGRTTISSQPQHSVRGRLTNGEHYMFTNVRWRSKVRMIFRGQPINK